MERAPFLIPEAVRDDFSQRAYAWALEQAALEVSAGFPLVAMTDSWTTRCFLAYLAPMSPVERLAYCQLCVRAFHQRGAQLSSEGLSAQDLVMFGRSVNERMEVLPFVAAGRSGLRPSELRREVRRLVCPLFGQPDVNWQPGALRFATTVKGWEVCLLVSCGKRPYYGLSALLGAEPLFHFWSVHSWLGVSSQTVWDRAPAGTEERVANTVLVGSEVLLAALPRLLPEVPRL